MKFARHQNGKKHTCNDLEYFLVSLALLVHISRIIRSDYRGLKKRITAVRRAQEGLAVQDTSDPESLDTKRESTVEDGERPLKSDSVDAGTPERSNELCTEGDAGEAEDAVNGEAEEAKMKEDSIKETDAQTSDVPIGRKRGGSVTFPSSPILHIVPSPSTVASQPIPPASHPSTVALAPSATAPSGIFAQIRHRSSTIRTTYSNPASSQMHPPHLSSLLESMTSVQLAFFDKLDAELLKIDSFYLAREQEARERCAVLREQLGELKDHRKIFHEAYPADHKRWSLSSIAHTARPRRAVHRRRHRSVQESSSREKSLERADAEKAVELLGNGHDNGKVKEELRLRYNPEDYTHAKKRLKKAVLEYYRGLEVLNNYRILNLTGFRKALKKFEKITKIPVQHAYMKEKVRPVLHSQTLLEKDICIIKVDPSAFASGEVVQGLVKEMEDQFAARFTRGDKKRALVRLRASSQHKTHHFSTFRTGLAFGLGVPALVDGIYRSFQPELRAKLAWEVMLFNYAILAIPAFFVFLVGLNVLVWSRSRINYVFIFEFDIRTRLDHREYFEIPAIVLATLCYSFWLTFARIGAESVAPTTWPLIWLLFVAGLILNPFPVLFKESRWWLIRNITRLLTSGVHRVEFADFWMGDQFCSLVFTLSNLYFFACSYIVGFRTDPWQQCAMPNGWGVHVVLASLPLLVRLVQSVRRWVDSGLITHLINGGKYGSGIIYYLAFYIWREKGAGRGPTFALFCLFGTIYSAYASSWDFLMDWSILKPHAKYPLLRSELVYSSYTPLYYFSVISNVLIRFIWVIYIPTQGRNFAVRTFIAAVLEMFRRWQWNFYRLENEHLGNMDQYRVTREVPLPYSFDEVGHESDGGDEDVEDEGHAKRSI
ncbi:hypothetical protein EW146_g1993 [Bondarzewia mesenterica]|uniref:EXS domain-containing protein n=1 Tax=Bondarzewia mesenterica TaxID=1095465 RepID=A0A4S4M4E4_9AGAM|nr:hypothetical protein EW146_g1993 [Bondarzewia mesenterica]